MKRVFILFAAAFMLTAETAVATKCGNPDDLHLRGNYGAHCISVIRIVNLSDSEKKQLDTLLAYLRSIAPMHPYIAWLLKRVESDSIVIDIYAFSVFANLVGSHTPSRQFKFTRDIEAKWKDATEQGAEGATFRLHGENEKADVVLCSECLNPSDKTLDIQYFAVTLLDEFEHCADLRFKRVRKKMDESLMEHLSLYQALMEENASLDSAALAEESKGHPEKASLLRDAIVSPPLIRKKYEIFKASYEELYPKTKLAHSPRDHP